MESIVTNGGDAALNHFGAFKWAGDGLALAGVAAGWAQILTPYSTILAFFYLCVRLYAERGTVLEMGQRAVAAVRKIPGLF